MNEKISVCIATYNGEKFICKQILSILSQLRSNDEIIISDDNSTDKTINIIKNINDDRIKLYANSGDKGYVPNFENALKKATGDIIFLSDQDDIWEQGKVRKCLELLRKYDFVVSDAIVVDEEDNILHNSYFTVRNPYKTLLGNLFKFGYLGCCMVFKKQILQKALPFPKKYKLCTHDNWLYLVANTFYTLYICSDKLIKYRRHGDNVSTGGMKNATNFLFKIRYRSYLLYNLVQRYFSRK